MYESFAQFIIQSYFFLMMLVFSKNNENYDGIFILSIFTSILSIVAKKWTQDRDVSYPDWQELDFNYDLLKQKICFWKNSDKNKFKQASVQLEKDMGGVIDTKDNNVDNIDSKEQV